MLPRRGTSPLPRLARAAASVAAACCVACQVASAPTVVPPDLPQPSAADFDVGIDGMYLTQSVQDHAGSVPLVEGRAGLLRIFLRATRPHVLAPAVRVHVVDTATGQPINSYTATSPMAEVPTYVLEGASGGSWDVAVPGVDVAAGRHLVAELEPVPGVAPDRFRGSFRHPPQGSLDVRPARRLLVTLVPIVQGERGPAPDVTRTRTADSWIDRARWIHPLGGVDVEVAAPYTTAIALGADGSGWADLVAELDRKRVLEGSGRTYLGIVHVPYASGTAGRADLGGRTAIAWDDARTYQRVAAHELGHNFGLLHAPCGTADAASVDPDFPYDGARTGAFGWDPASGALKDPAATWDHMSYCGDAETTWTSDYNYRAAMAFLGGDAPATAPSAVRALALAVDASPGRQPCLVVSGRIRGGDATLDAAYAVETTPTAPRGGEYGLDLLDAAGGRLASFDVAPARVAPEAGGEGEAHFAAAIPLSPAWSGAVEALALRRRGVEVARRVRAPGAEVLVRDARSGAVRAFARGGAAPIGGAREDVEVLASDGVGSERAVASHER
jgi:hypothetical protein